MTVGRPSKLNDELLEKARGYLATCTEDINTDDGGRLSWVELELPSFAGLALHLDIDKQTITDWCALAGIVPSEEASVEEVSRYALHKEFSRIATRVQLEQERRLVNGTAGRKYDSKVAPLVLSHVHGYRMKSEQDITSGGQPLTVQIVKYNDDKKTDGGTTGTV